ncbi:hypothetical protein ACH6CV_14310 [Bacillota bacterium Meth-B3]
MDQYRFDATPYLAAAIARNEKCRRRLQATFKLNRAACHAAARQSDYYNHPVIVSGRAEQAIMARRALGVLLCALDVDDVLAILRDGWRPVWQALSAMPHDAAVSIPFILHGPKSRLTYNQTIDMLVAAVTMVSKTGRALVGDKDTREVMDLLNGYDAFWKDVRPVFTDRMHPHKAKARILFSGVVLPGETGIADAFGADRYRPVELLADAMGMSIDEYVDGIYLTSADQTACVLASDGDDEAAKDLALWALTFRAIQQDRAFCLESFRDDQVVAVEAARRDAERAENERKNTIDQLTIANKQIDELSRKLAAAEARAASLEADRQELAALRTALYAAQQAETGEPIPEAARLRDLPPGILSIGGRDTWARRMRELFPQAKFIPADVTFTDADVRGASELWFASQYMGHSDFYRAVSIARANNVPVRYFPSTGIEACARALTGVE